MHAGAGEGAIALVVGVAGSAGSLSTASPHNHPGNQGRTGIPSPNYSTTNLYWLNVCNRGDAWRSGRRTYHVSVHGSGKACCTH